MVSLLLFFSPVLFRKVGKCASQVSPHPIALLRVAMADSHKFNQGKAVLVFIRHLLGKKDEESRNKVGVAPLSRLKLKSPS